MSFGWAALRLARAAAARTRIDVLQLCQPPDIYFPLAWLLRWAGARVVVDQRDLMPELLGVARHGGPPAPLMRLLRLARAGSQRVAHATSPSTTTCGTGCCGPGPPGRSIVGAQRPVLRRAGVQRCRVTGRARGRTTCWCGPGRWAARTGSTWCSGVAERGRPPAGPHRLPLRGARGRRVPRGARATLATAPEPRGPSVTFTGWVDGGDGVPAPGVGRPRAGHLAAGGGLSGQGDGVHGASACRSSASTCRRPAARRGCGVLVPPGDVERSPTPCWPCSTTRHGVGGSASTGGGGSRTSSRWERQAAGLPRRVCRPVGHASTAAGRLGLRSRRGAAALA